MSKQEQKIKDRLNKTFHKTKEAPRTCCVKTCNGTAINSHVLQKNGILDSISEDNHIWLLNFNYFNDDLFYFKRVGINQAFTFKGFCSEHDNEIFKPIESEEIDYENYKNQLLFAYRTILNELVKKQTNIEWRKRQQNDEILKELLDFGTMKITDDQEKLGINDITYCLDRIEEDFNNDTQNFVFKVRYTKSSDVCLASHFTYESVRNRTEMIKETGKDFDILTDIFVSFFPLSEENVFIIGYLKEFENKCVSFVQEFINCNDDLFFKKISNLLLCRCEMWACSETFYKHTLNQEKKK